MFFSNKDKIKSLEEISIISDRLKKDGKKIVTLNGSFDLFHAGHLYIIKESKAQGDILIIGLNSDLSYKNYKDERGPIINQHNRASILAALELVDYLVIFDETVPINFLESVKPSVHCNGAEYGKDCLERATVERNGGKLFLIPEMPQDKGSLKISTTSIVETILERYSKEKNKAIFLDWDVIIDFNAWLEERLILPVIGAHNLLIDLSRLNYKLFITTDKSLSNKESDDIIKIFKTNNVNFEYVYTCTHDKEKEVCGCRKPNSGLIQKAKKEHNIDMLHSWVIACHENDCIAAKRLQVNTILLSPEFNNYSTKPDSADYLIQEIMRTKEIIKS